MRFFIVFVLVFQQFHGLSQGYTNWIVGDTTDFETQSYLSGIVLAGGGGDNDDAMRWMLERAAGGDVLIIRASNSDGYNDYFYEELGVSVNSVETIRFDNFSASTNPYVLRRISEAEVLFIAGGDQYDYYELWKDTPVEDEINALINTKGITVGGTSAGMAILGKVYYTPSGGSLDTDEALANPFHPDADIIGKDDFLDVPILSNVITDTHYDQRDRPGRHMVFLARTLHDFAVDRSYGIACNEYTVVAIDENGLGKVFGEWPDFDDYAYFMRSNCQNEYLPETLVEDQAFTWNRNNAAVHVYKVPGTKDGLNYVDLASPEWETWEGGTLQNWFVIDAELTQQDVTQGDCASIVSTKDQPIFENNILISPNPFEDFIQITSLNQSLDQVSFKVVSVLGDVLISGELNQEETVLNLSELGGGIYFIRYMGRSFKIIKS